MKKRSQPKLEGNWRCRVPINKQKEIDSGKKKLNGQNDASMGAVITVIWVVAVLFYRWVPI